MDRLKRYIIWPVVSIAVFLVIAEAALRLIDVNPHPQGRDFTVNHALDYPEVFLRDRDLFWRFHPGQTITSEFFEGCTYQINYQGFRGPDFALQKSGWRVAVLGNSCSFGWRMTDDETYASRLQSRLRAAGLADAEVDNFSVPGYSSFQGVRNYRRYVRQYQPDIVVISYAWNDHWLAAGNRPDKDQRLPPQAIIALQNALARLRIYRLMKGLLLTIIPGPDTTAQRNYLTRVSLQDFRENLTELAHMARKDGARVIFLTSPIPSLKSYYGLNRQSYLHESHRYYNEVIRETAAANSVGLVDLAAVFDRRLGLFDDVSRDPFHYNREGHALASDEIFRFMVEAGYLGDRD